MLCFWDQVNLLVQVMTGCHEQCQSHENKLLDKTISISLTVVASEEKLMRQMQMPTPKDLDNMSATLSAHIKMKQNEITF